MLSWYGRLATPDMVLDNRPKPRMYRGRISRIGSIRLLKAFLRNRKMVLKLVRGEINGFCRYNTSRNDNRRNVDG